jgi:hypothetical protein
MFVLIMKKKYPAILSDTERDQLKSLIAAGTAPARKLTHARILLKANQGSEGPGWVDEQVSGSSPLVGSLFFAQEALDTFIIPSIIASGKSLRAS